MPEWGRADAYVEVGLDRASYSGRYNILCGKLIQEQLYTAASVIVAPRSGVEINEYSEFGDMMGLRTFISGQAGHIAAGAART